MGDIMEGNFHGQSASLSPDIHTETHPHSHSHFWLIYDFTHGTVFGLWENSKWLYKSNGIWMIFAFKPTHQTSTVLGICDLANCLFLILVRKTFSKESVSRIHAQYQLLCGVSFLGPVEHVQLLAPFVVIRNKEINITAVVLPSHSRTVTYFWWIGNNTEVIPSRRRSKMSIFQL